MVSRLPPKNRYGRGRANLRALPRVGDDHVLFEHARADAQERHAIPVAAVHVRLDLEDEPAERRRVRRNQALVAHPRRRRRRQFRQRLQERLQPEVRERAAEEDRRVPEVEIACAAERRAGPGDEGRLVDQVLAGLGAEQLDEPRIVRGRHLDGRRVRAALPFVEMHAAALQVEHAAETVAAADRPVHAAPHGCRARARSHRAGRTDRGSADRAC